MDLLHRKRINMTARKTDFSKQQYIDVYPPGMEFHFWSVARCDYLKDTLLDNGFDRQLDVALEVGAGRGIVVEVLRKSGINIYGCDLAIPPYVSPEVSQYMEFGIKAETMPEKFRISVTYLLLLDVLEHIEDRPTFLNSLTTAFPHLKTIVITVPSRMELWSNYDDYFGHLLRYDIPSLRSETPKGFVETKSQYFFKSLYLVMLAFKLFKIKREVSFHPPVGFYRIIHLLVAKLMKFEKAFLWFLPGSSLLMIVKKQR